MISAQNKQAREVGELELSKYVIKCGDSWFVQGWILIWELRNKGHSELIENKLTESDKLNGFEYKSVLKWSYKGSSRCYTKRQWDPWEERTHYIDIFISKKNGRWIAEKSKSLAGGDYYEISCNGVPGRASELKDRGRPGRPDFEGIIKYNKLYYESKNSFLEKEKQKADLALILPKIEGHWEMAGYQIYFSPSKLVGKSLEGSLVFVLPDFTSVSSDLNIYNAEKGLNGENDKRIIQAINNQIEYMKKYSGRIFHAKYRIYGKLANNPKYQNAERILLNVGFTPPPQDPIWKYMYQIFFFFLEGGDHVLYVHKDGKYIDYEIGYSTGNIQPYFDKRLIIKYIDSKIAPEVEK